jgi:hypothetical protein
MQPAQLVRQGHRPGAVVQVQPWLADQLANAVRALGQMA